MSIYNSLFQGQVYCGKHIHEHKVIISHILQFLGCIWSASFFENIYHLHHKRIAEWKQSIILLVERTEKQKLEDTPKSYPGTVNTQPALNLLVAGL
jgi:hypothetical protein